MRTDRELLEAAAKARGWRVVSRWEFEGLNVDVGGGATVVKWNPLTDDGDALRLAVTLHMTIAHEPSRGGWSVGRVVATVGGGEFRWLSNDDDCKRAIVLAAAALGAPSTPQPPAPPTNHP